MTTVLPARGNALTRWFGRSVLRVMGWRAQGRLPETPKMVVVAAPHSSGWDFVVGISFMISLGVGVRFIGKKELFRGPMGWLLRWLGGISVDRDQAGGVVDQVAAEFARVPAMVLGIAPEGTRRHGADWKTGFYRIAVKAGVPIVPGYFDWSRRTVGLLPAFTPTGDVETDLPAFRWLYRSFTRKDGLTMPVPPPLR